MKRAGHQHSEIMDLTIDQMLFYYADAIQARVDYMLDVRAAVWTDEKGIEKYINKIVEGH